VPAHGDVTQGGSHKRLAHPDRPGDAEVTDVVDEAQRGQLRPQLTVEDRFGGVVEGF
jgi:hypothetical protein